MTAACPLCGDEKHDSWCGANYEDSAGDCNCVGTERRKGPATSGHKAAAPPESTNPHNVTCWCGFQYNDANGYYPHDHEKFRKTEPWITSCLICGNVAMAYNRIPEWAKKDLAKYLTPPAEAFRAEPVGFTREELGALQNACGQVMQGIEAPFYDEEEQKDYEFFKALAEKARRMAEGMK